MNTVQGNPHNAKLDALAEDYARDGFVVLKEPSPGQLPFDLGDYRPDLVAIKGDTGLVVEVKASASRISIDRLQQTAGAVASHPGWRFLLVTLDDVDSRKIPTTAIELPTWPELEAKLAQVKGLLEKGMAEPALLYLWSVFEAALRRRAIAQNIPVERLPANSLLRHLYSQGEISVDQIDTLEEFFDRRNRLAHGAKETIDADFVQRLVLAVGELIAEWREGKPDDSAACATA
jgi:hypothetical protein